MNLSKEEKKILLQIARSSIAEELKDKKPFKFEEDYPPNLIEKYGVFVTLTIDEQLRGCIGYILGFTSLYEQVYEAAKKAAFEDPRFTPLSEEEFDQIEIEISVLSVPKKIKSIDEIKIGKHGLIIEKEHHHGLLLPQVAVKYNWNREDFLDHTCQKAGLRKHDWKSLQTKIEIFSAVIFSEKQMSKGK
ncbi:MAG: AmmeMemoRadiSam system protein A [Bacteroidetes bacterium]|nr:AmmeMemoRadiSam system protein A [Bacteroidota bacterium]MBU2585049.1 AmmeMemoRadiSam system protein A [Bacteroidota bacterium]